jgi:hypothetical protein
MSVDARSMRSAAIALLALGAGLAFGRWSVPAREAATAPAANEVLPPPAALAPAAPDQAPSDLTGLRACVRRLGEAEARIERECARAASPPPGEAAPAMLPAQGTAGQGSSSAGGPSAPPASDDHAGEAPAAAAARAFSASFMTHVVGVNDADARWLQEYACLVEDRRRRMEAELSAHFADPKHTSDRAEIDRDLAEAKEERDAMLADIEARLGKERYKRMRDVGGLGILSRSCPPRP